MCVAWPTVANMHTDYTEITAEALAVREGVTLRTIQRWCLDCVSRGIALPCGGRAERRGRRAYRIFVPARESTP